MNKSLHPQISASDIADGLQPSKRGGVLLALYTSVSLLFVISIIFGRGVILPATDFHEVWHPFAEGVYNGAIPYTEIWDNKPPVFHFINIALYATGFHELAWVVVIVVSNALTAFLIWKWATTHGLERAGMVGGFLFLLALPISNGYTLDPRLLANVFILLGFLTKRIEYAGVSLAIAGLLSQFSVLAIPVVAWYHVHDLEWRGKVWRAARFATVGLAVFAASYVAVALIWDVQAAIDGLRFSVFSLEGYTEQFVERGKSAFASLTWFFGRVQERLQYGAVLFGLAALGLLGSITGSDRRHAQFSIMLAVTAFLLVTPIVIRGAPDYYTLMLPFVALLAGIGVAGDRDTANKYDVAN